MTCTTCSLPMYRCCLNDTYYEAGFWWHRVCSREVTKEGQLQILFPGRGRFLNDKLEDDNEIL